MAGNIYHSWNGTVLTITSDSGTSSAELRGEDGCRGAQGIPGGTCYNVSIAPRNWLDNSYFVNPINQRGQTNYSGTWTYCIDRWRTTTVGEGKVWVSTGNVGIPSNGRIIQCIDVNKADWVGKKFTFAAALTTGAIYIGSGTIQEQNAETVYHINVNYNGLRVRLYSVDNSNYMYATIINETAYNQPFVWAALYEGEYTAETLPAYQYKGYAAELLECQRYYIKVATQPINGWCYNWGRVAAFVPLPVKMRVPYPTVVLAQETPNFYVNATAYNAALEGSTSVENGVVIYYTHTAAINGQCVIPEFAAEINADL